MNLKEDRETEANLLSIIRALRSDLNNPEAFARMIAKYRQDIAQLEKNLAEALERRERLPLLLEEAERRLIAHRAQKPSVAKRINELEALRTQIEAFNKP